MNRFGKTKYCPHCKGSVKLRVGLVPALVGFVPAVIATALLKPWLGPLSVGIAIGALMFLSFRLRPVVQ